MLLDGRPNKKKVMAITERSKSLIPHGTGSAKPKGLLWVIWLLGKSTASLAPPVSIAKHTGLAPSSSPNRIVAGMDRASWFRDGLTNKIVRITTSETISEHDLSAPDRLLGGLTLGPDRFCAGPSTSGVTVASFTNSAGTFAVRRLR